MGFLPHQTSSAESLPSTRPLSVWMSSSSLAILQCCLGIGKSNVSMGSLDGTHHIRWAGSVSLLLDTLWTAYKLPLRQDNRAARSKSTRRIPQWQQHPALIRRKRAICLPPWCWSPKEFSSFSKQVSLPYIQALYSRHYWVLPVSSPKPSSSCPWQGNVPLPLVSAVFDAIV